MSTRSGPEKTEIERKLGASGGASNESASSLADRPALSSGTSAGESSESASSRGELPAFYKEWLVTDGHGAFAMGTTQGIRIRKYHGLFLGIAGRSEAAFLADLEISVNGKPLWPHRYRGDQGSLIHPDPSFAQFRFIGTSSAPEWEWDLPDPEGVLRFAVRPQRLRGIELQWSWQSTAKPRRSLELQIRPFFAMRPLHSVGGTSWVLEPQSLSEPSHIRIRAAAEETPVQEPVYALLSGNWTWNLSPDWYYNFLYTEELARGYPGEENLFSAGYWDLKLKGSESARMLLSEDAEIFNGVPIPRRKAPVKEGRSALDFILQEPAGIVAGYPWFGEWGRDTFISLPGLAIRWTEAGGKAEEVSSWTDEVFTRWGQWIQLTGMLPNLLEKTGTHQWESADGALWWCHALASLWSFGLAGRKEFQGLPRKYKPILDHVIESIEIGRHVFLRRAHDGLLEVTEPHTTWMDARVEGCAVTPRTGRLPEINALWFQARCLQMLWSERESDFSELVALGLKTLEQVESDRPNFIFLHSIPLAPSFVLREIQALRGGLSLAEEFWTPVGLRTLKPGNSGFIAQCVGTQPERDRAYHQGTVWAWLGGHFEMAKERVRELAEDEVSGWETFPPAMLKEMPIEGHIPEIFDAEEPFTPRGAPAQAWSLACLAEARARKRLNVDQKLSDVLARRWLGREGRQVRGKSRGKGTDLAGGI